MRNICVSLLLLCTLTVSGVLSGCAEKAGVDKDIEAKGQEYDRLTKSRNVQVVEDQYVGVKGIPIKEDVTKRAELKMPVFLKAHGPLPYVISKVNELTPLHVQVGGDPQGMKSGGKGGGPELILDISESTNVNVDYEGPLLGLLDQIAYNSGYGWDYDPGMKSVTFQRLIIRTFTILGAPGTHEYTDSITNKSKDNTGSSSLGGNVGSTVQTSDTSVQTSQENKTKFTFDVWANAEIAIKSLLSPEGTVVSNQVAGTITVKDHFKNIRNVEVYVKDMNTRLSRQVALTVHVWALEVDKSNEAGVDLTTIFSDKNIVVNAGSLQTPVGAASTAAISIVKGKLKGSAGLLKALRQWGNATQVTSGGGVTLSNQPMPIQAIKRIAYLASSASSQTDYSQTTTLTPGEITTGFSMTIIPHILDRRRVILQYSVNLSKLDALEEFSSNDTTIQLPKTSTRAFSQRSTLQMGETLVLAGFQEQTQTLQRSLGLLNFGGSGDYSRTMLIITIETEAAGGGTED